jgi:hypothetical protein
MPIDELISGLDAQLTDERVLEAVQEFLTAIGHRLQYDSETIVFASDVKVHVVDKSLVIDRAKRNGAYMSARAVFDPLPAEHGNYSGLSRGGTLKIIFNLAGEYIDDVYSRANVVDE